MSEQLAGRQVVIKLSDPWELGESLGWQPLSAVIVAAKGNDEVAALLVRLKQPFVFKDLRCEYFIAVPRLETSRLAALATGEPVFCAITRVGEDRLEADDPFDLSWWRGGVAGIGEVATI